MIILFPLDKTKGFKMNQNELVERHIITETPEEFEKRVDDLVWQKDITYLEAVEELTKHMEVENVPPLLTKNLYAMLQREAESLSLLKTKANRIF